MEKLKIKRGAWNKNYNGLFFFFFPLSYLIQQVPVNTIFSFSGSFLSLEDISLTSCFISFTLSLRIPHVFIFSLQLTARPFLPPFSILFLLLYFFFFILTSIPNAASSHLRVPFPCSACVRKKICRAYHHLTLQDQVF